MRERIYQLNGEKIKSSDCYGFLHTVKRVENKCLDCHKLIKIGQQYIQFNYPFSSDMRFHVQCFKESHGDEKPIIGVKLKKIKTFWGSTKTYVVCQELEKLDIRRY